MNQEVDFYELINEDFESKGLKQFHINKKKPKSNIPTRRKGSQM